MNKFRVVGELIGNEYIANNKDDMRMMQKLHMLGFFIETLEIEVELKKLQYRRK
jgi:hypothetical protein